MLPKLLYSFLFITLSFLGQAQESRETYVEEDTNTVVPPTDEEVSKEKKQDYVIESKKEEEDSLEITKFDSSYYPLKANANLSDTVNKLLTDEEFWYVKASFKKKEKKAQQPSESSAFWDFLGSQTFIVIMWVLFAGIILTAVVFFLVENDIVRFRKKAAELKQTETPEKEENIFEIDFEKRIQQAIDANNYTLATRLLMLRLLKNLSLKQHIGYSIDKTNLDYQVELSSKPFSPQVNKCIYFYDYVSYGDFEVTNSQFQFIYNQFNQTEKSI